MADLKTDYKDDVLDTTQNTKRKYQMINNDDGTVSFEDVTEYLQQGDSFGADDINDTNEEVNIINDKLIKEIVYTGTNAIIAGNYITLSKDVSNCRQLEIHCSASPHSSVTAVPVNIILPPLAGDSYVSVITRSQDKTAVYTHIGAVGLDPTDGTKLNFSMGYRITTNVSGGTLAFYENSSQITITKVIAVG